MLRKMLRRFWGKMCLCNDEIYWGKMPLVVMKFVGAKYGNKNVKIILVEKMMLCNDEIFWGKIVSGNLPPVPITTRTYELLGISSPVMFFLFLPEYAWHTRLVFYQKQKIPDGRLNKVEQEAITKTSNQALNT